MTFNKRAQEEKEKKNGYGYDEREWLFCGSFSYLGIRHLFAECNNKNVATRVQKSLTLCFLSNRNKYGIISISRSIKIFTNKNHVMSGESLHWEVSALSLWSQGELINKDQEDLPFISSFRSMAIWISRSTDDSNNHWMAVNSQKMAIPRSCRNIHRHSTNCTSLTPVLFQMLPMSKKGKVCLGVWRMGDNFT